MKRIFRRILSLALCMMMCLALVPMTAGAEDSFEPVTINIRVMNEVLNVDKVIARYQEMVKDDPILSKITPNITWVAGADYKDKLSMAVNAEEDYDLMFCGSWHGLSSYIAQGAFKDITEYFCNPNFPGLEKGFSQDYVNAAKSFVKNENGEYESKLFVIPLSESFEVLRGLTYREDLRAKYGVPEITDDTILRQYIDTVLENEEDMIGWSMYNGFFFDESVRYSAMHDNVFWYESTEILGQETPFYVAISPDNKTVLNAVVMGDSAEEFAKMPEGYQYDFIKEYEVERVKWADVLDPNRGMAVDITLPAAVTYNTLTGVVQAMADEESKGEGGSIRFYITEEDQRDHKEGAIVSEMKTNNQMVVPAWSEKTDAVMHFLDWMFGSQEAHDLFQYGVPGDDWELVDGKYVRNLRSSDDPARYAMPGYSFTWNPNYILFPETIKGNAELTAMYEYMYAPTTFTPTIMSGFTFDRAPVETQIANVTALSGELMTRFALHGDETATRIDQWHQDAMKVGLEEIRTELISQLQSFLNAKNSAN